MLYTSYINPKNREHEKFSAYKYLISNGFVRFSKDPDTPILKKIRAKSKENVLTMFDGGVVFMNLNDIDPTSGLTYQETFLRCLGRDAFLGGQHFFNQIATKDFRYAMDIDCTRTLTQNEVDVLSSTIFRVLSLHFPTHIDSIRVSTAVSGPKPKKNKMVSNVHAVSNTIVDLEQANQITHKIISLIYSESIISMNNVEIDNMIYKDSNSGESVNLRMVFSHKSKEPCGCKKFCMICKGSKTKVSTFVYQPYTYTTSKGVVHYHSDQTIENYELASLHFSLWGTSSDVRNGFQIPKGDVKIPRPTKKRKKATVSNTKTTTKRTKTTTSEKQYMELNKFINKLKIKKPYPTTYEHVDVKRLIDRGDKINVYLSNTGSGMCPYSGKDHGNTRIYFIAHKTGIMKLHCQNAICKTIQGDDIKLPKRITNLLFKK